MGRRGESPLDRVSEVWTDWGEERSDVQGQEGAGSLLVAFRTWMLV